MEIIWSDTGDGDPYLLLHGGAGPASFGAFAGVLAEHGRVITPTHPGFGGTPRPPHLDGVAALAAAYHDLLEELDLSEVCLVGNSLGGWVAAEMALARSPRVAAAVLVDAVGIEVPGHQVADPSTLTREELAARAWYDPSRAPDPATLPPDVRATLPGNTAALAAYGGSALQDKTLLARLADMTVPVLVAWGEADQVVDLDYGRAYAAAIPGSRFEVVPRAGHLPQVEDPDALLALVLALVSATARTRPATSGG